MTSTYKPNGKAHLVLARLERGPATLTDLGRAMGSRRRVWHVVVTAMARDGLMEKHDLWHATAEGLEVLDRLRRGECVTIHAGAPSVRIFARAA